MRVPLMHARNRFFFILAFSLGLFMLMAGCTQQGKGKQAETEFRAFLASFEARAGLGFGRPDGDQHLR